MIRNYLLLALLLNFYLLQGQSISSITVLPSLPFSCSNVSVAIRGSFNCANASITGTSSSVVDDVIYIDVAIMQPFICLPAIVSYTTSHHVGMIPAGSYTLTVRTFLNGAFQASSTMPISVGGDLHLDQSPITSGTYMSENILTASATIIENAIVNFRAAGEIHLNAGFTVETGASLSLEIITSSELCSDP